jgi:HSP20 family protein
MTRSCAISPWSTMDSSLSRLFHDFVSPASFPAQTFGAKGLPPLAAWETESEYTFEVELPGLADGDVEVEILDGVLTLRGTLPSSLPEGAKVLRNERTAGEFVRSVRLPGEVDEAGVEAHLDRGVLRISLPKRPEARPRRIEIGRAKA